MSGVGVVTAISRMSTSFLGGAESRLPHGQQHLSRHESKSQAGPSPH